MPPPDARLAAGSPASSAIPPGDAEQALWFAEEVLPHEPTLRAWLRSRFPSLADGDDVVQEAYVRLIRARRQREVEDTKSYLFAVARNVVLDLFRRNSARPTIASSDYERSSVMDERTGVAESICNSQEFEILKQAIDALPVRCREIMTLQKIQGLSNQEIAQKLEVSVNTVNAQVVIGLARCRRYLLARGVLRGGRT